MSYYNLGNNCISRTCAITSNEKFLSPFSNIYNQKYTKNTLFYPGHEEDINLYSPSKPNMIDNIIFNVKDRIQDRRDKRDFEIKQEKRQCKNC